MKLLKMVTDGVGVGGGGSSGSGMKEGTGKFSCARARWPLADNDTKAEVGKVPT